MCQAPCFYDSVKGIKSQGAGVCCIFFCLCLLILFLSQFLDKQPYPLSQHLFKITFLSLTFHFLLFRTGNNNKLINGKGETTTNLSPGFPLPLPDKENLWKGGPCPLLTSPLILLCLENCSSLAHCLVATASKLPSWQRLLGIL